MKNYLVVSAIGKDRPGIVEKLSETILDCGCDINESRMTLLGGEFAIIILVAGQWNQLAKLESGIESIKDELGLLITVTRTEAEAPNKDLLSYFVEIISLDHPGIVHQIANFFAHRDINIREMNTHCYAAAHTGTPMFSVNMIINIPSSVRVAALREEFLEFCDEFNMDAVLEPSKS